MEHLQLGLYILYACPRVTVDDERRNKLSAVAEMGNRLATIDMGRKVGGGCCATFWGAGSPSNAKWPGLRPTSVPSGILIHPASNPYSRLATTDMGRKLGAAVPLLGVLGPHVTMWPGPRPKLTP